MFSTISSNVSMEINEIFILVDDARAQFILHLKFTKENCFLFKQEKKRNA